MSKAMMLNDSSRRFQESCNQFEDLGIRLGGVIEPGCIDERNGSTVQLKDRCQLDGTCARL